MRYFFIIIILILLSNTAHPCTCIGENSIKKEFRKSDYVFLGKVKSKKEIIFIDSVYSNNFEYHFYSYVFEVSEIFKGELSTTEIEIITGVGEGDCGYQFEIGQDYIVYSYFKTKYYSDQSEVPKYLYTNICSRTKLKNEDEIIQLKRCHK